ncbi:hypothetical protein CSV79_03800 [Sporosarcina sp. P13]|nr:hypothetical protein CSV79_03800 [Sporosarcina sp. P13]
MPPKRVFVYLFSGSSSNNQPLCILVLRSLNHRCFDIHIKSFQFTCLLFHGNNLIPLLVCLQSRFLTRFFILTFKGFSIRVYIIKCPQGGVKVNKWKVDQAKSTIRFSVPHMMVSKVSGTFETFSGELQGNIADLTRSAIRFK